MARFWAMWSVGVALLLALLIGMAGAVGQARGGEMLRYVAADLNNSFLAIYDLDVAFRIPIRLVRQDNLTYDLLFPSPNGQLAFYSCDENIRCDLLVWNGKELLNLTNETSINPHVPPAWSTDGKLAFLSCIPFCDVAIWDGSSIFTVIDTPNYNEAELTWGSNGQLAFQSCAPTCEVIVWNGDTLLHIGNTPDRVVDNLTWSLNGQLAFRSCGYNECDVMVWDGTVLHNLVNILREENFRQEDIGFAWNRTEELAFRVCTLDGCNVVIWDGVTVQPVVGLPNQFEASPTWSLDGRLAFISCDNQRGGCDVLLWEDGNLTNITNQPQAQHNLVWSIDEQLAFVSCPANCDVLVWSNNTLTNISNTPFGGEDYLTWDVEGQLAFVEYSTTQEIMLWDGTRLTQLTHTPTLNEYAPVWLP